MREKRKKIDSRDRICAALEHKTLDRIPICETHFWPETIKRWQKEGLPGNTEPVDYFELDKLVVDYPVDCGFFPYEIFEETQEYRIDLNPYGTTVKYPLNGGSSAGHSELDHKVKTIEDWRKAKERLTATNDRILKIQEPKAGAYVTISPVDHFWMSFRMCGLENLCCWLLQKPEEMREIYHDYVTFLLEMLDLYVERGAEFDGVWFFSDMAYCSGPMFSPQIFRDVISPGYERIKDWCKKNKKAMLLHTDGNISKLLPELIRIGFDWVQPLEARAGNDVRTYKDEYGDQITLMGNINADILATGQKNEIEDEIASKIMIAKKNGGYIYHIDHSVPPTISFEAYAHAIEMVKKYGSY